MGAIMRLRSGHLLRSDCSEPGGDESIAAIASIWRAEGNVAEGQRHGSEVRRRLVEIGTAVVTTAGRRSEYRKAIEERRLGCRR